MNGWVLIHKKILEWEWYGNTNMVRLFLHLLLKASWKEEQWHGHTIERGALITSYRNLAKETGLSVQSVRTCLAKMKSTHELTHKLTHKLTHRSHSKFSYIKLNNYDQYQVPNTPTNTPTNTQTNNILKNKRIKETTVANATGLTLNNESYMLEELTYEPLVDKPKRSAIGRKTMHRLAYHYLKLKGIKIASGEKYDANKISKGLSKLYRESGKDLTETMRRLTLGAEYFKKKELDWTPEAVWRRWEDINKSNENRFNSDLYE